MHSFSSLLLAIALAAVPSAQSLAQGVPVVERSATAQNKVTLRLTDGRQLVVDFYSPSIFRLFLDPSGGAVRPPHSNPPAQILVDNPRKDVGNVSVEQKDGFTQVSTKAVRISLDHITGTLSVTDLRTGKQVFNEVAPVRFTKNNTTLTLSAQPKEYFYGGGVQNGRFSHRGQRIDIVNNNSWTDGGVCSPAPFYWSTAGYGLLFHTFRPGSYDFGSKQTGQVTLSHDEPYLDLFVMVDKEPVALLNDYYQLTGHPVLLPKFAFYEGHLNAYNRDYWKEVTDGKSGILFPDGKRYVESQKDNGGIRESLNGELDGNYQFSARAVIDHYAKMDLPLGWLLPNDGYGAGYGQTSTLDGNIANLRSLTEYAHDKGVEIGLWTQSDLHPVDSIPALLQRDLAKEVGEAGVRVLKTDVAWVGAGYSFGLNGIAEAARIMTEKGNNARPFIITLDGWAGTQRYGGVWTGDQTGGEWEYIRFHIPTYIGAGLSGMSNITSDMDGIFGGRNLVVNMRDFQWKAFTPMQLNMDGWGANPKYPDALGEPATSVNRAYLKLKSMLQPYTYTLAHQAVDGKPMLRAMFLDDANAFTLGTATRYQYMYGPWLLVAPVYRATAAANKQGDDVRNGIYLPEGHWYDYFSKEAYEGGCVLENYKADYWKLPVFVRGGAIIPMTTPHNNVKAQDRSLRVYDFFPEGNSTFTQYDDDGVTEAYRSGVAATTVLSSSVDTKKSRLTIDIQPTQGRYDGMQAQQRTELRIRATKMAKRVTVKVNGKELKDVTVRDFVRAASQTKELSPLSRVTAVNQPYILVSIPTLDITSSHITVEMKGYENKFTPVAPTHRGKLAALASVSARTTPYTATPKWSRLENADYYEVLFDSVRHTRITADSLVIEDLRPTTTYTFKVRPVNVDGVGEWVTLTATTKENPLADALHGITGSLDGVKSQPGEGLRNLFDFDTTGSLWHTDYNNSTVPFTLTLDLHQMAQLDRFDYVPRNSGRNGMLQQGTIEWSRDGREWHAAGEFNWKSDASVKTVKLTEQPTARYLRLRVTKAVGNFGSGQEIYVYKVEGTKPLLLGDVNQDGKIDENDLTSYMNYTGLKRGDADFDGYISNGDINGNGSIDALDISYVTTQLDGGVSDDNGGQLQGNLSLAWNKSSYKAGEEVVLTVKGEQLAAVNALGLAVPYSAADLEFVRVEPLVTHEMRNLTYNRRHTDGSQVLYPTFLNVGQQPLLEGTYDALFRLHFRARRAFRALVPSYTGVLVDRHLHELSLPAHTVQGKATTVAKEKGTAKKKSMKKRNRK